MGVFSALSDIYSNINVLSVATSLNSLLHKIKSSREPFSICTLILRPEFNVV